MPRLFPSMSLPSLRQIWFQLHWFVGITAGTVLVVMALSGAALSFREELLDLFNPGVRSVMPQPQLAPLTPPQLLQSAESLPGQPRVASITVYAEAGAAARLSLAPAPGQRRGETLYLNPYTGELQPPLQGQAAFDWIEQLHRWLLLPREPGRQVAGALVLGLLGLALSGLYLRWPREALNWRHWLSLDWRLKGRSFLWGLHSVLGTWVLVVYVLSASTGLYWSFDIVKSSVEGWVLGKSSARAEPARNNKPSGNSSAEKPAALPELSLAWRVFEQQAPGWQQASLRLPERPAQALQITWLAGDAPHERARNRLSVLPLTGEIKQDERFAQQSAGARALGAIYPLHMGTYFGLPGRLIITLASLCMPVFAVTGWLLYLGRRRAKRAVQAERAKLVASSPTSSADSVLLIFASQSGQAERLALQSAASLQAAGLALKVCAVDGLQPEDLLAHGRVLLVASSFGEGEPPDGARRFWRALQASRADLSALRFGLLALGDSHYTHFCGFGHALAQRLQALGAQPLFPLIEVDDGDAQALARWAQALQGLEGAAQAAFELAPAAEAGPAYERWTLVSRELLNPGSQGGPLYEVTLSSARAQDWRPGALVELQVPEQAPRDAQTLQPQAPRRYSVASLPEDGTLQLLVRLQQHGPQKQGLGLASGWLCVQAPLGSELQLRLLPNPGFEAPQGEAAGAPCIFIGNGSGLAGLRAHLRARVRAGQQRNWLLFGERERAHDSLCAAEIEAWQAQGFLPHLDRVFSREAQGRAYVQDRLRESGEALRAWVAQGACLYVCGSLQGMAAGVDAALVEALGQPALDELAAAGRYRRDVY